MAIDRGATEIGLPRTTSPGRAGDLQFERVQSIDPDRVLVATKFAGVSKRGSVPVEQSSAAIVTVRDGKIARTVIYDSAEDALEVAGLSE